MQLDRDAVAGKGDQKIVELEAELPRQLFIAMPKGRLLSLDITPQLGQQAHPRPVAELRNDALLDDGEGFEDLDSLREAGFCHECAAVAFDGNQAVLGQPD